MAFDNVNQRLNGINPLAYLGVNALQPTDFVRDNRDPLPSDFKNFYLGTWWLNQTTTDLFYLARLQAQTATWIMIGGGGGTILTLTGNTGGAVGPTAGNINVVGDGTTITIAGNPGTSTLTASTTGIIPDSFPTDFTSPATPAAGVLNIFGGTSSDAEQVALVYRKNVHTAAVTNTVFVKLNDALSFPATTANGRAGVIYSGGVAANNTFIHSYGATGNTFLGLASGNFTLTPGVSIGNVGVGLQSLQSLTIAEYNCCVGNGSGLTISTSSNNTSLGSQSLQLLATGAGDNVALGQSCGQNLLTGSGNVLIGSGAGYNYIGAESNNICIGFETLGVNGDNNIIRIGTYNAAPGAGQQNKCYIAACYSNYGTANAFVGVQSGNTTLTVGSAVSNAALGAATLTSLTTGHQNTAIGQDSQNLNASSISNVSVGWTSLSSLASGAGTNVSIGAASGSNLLTGSSNVYIGSAAGQGNVAAETSNIYIGTLVVGAAESNTLRIGLPTGGGAGALNKSFIAGIRGVTTDAADAVAVLISSTGQLGTVSSSARYKENIEDMDSYSSAITFLRPVVFNYKKHSPESKSVGLIAEEVAGIMPQLVVYDKDGLPETVKYHDLVPMLLNELLKLDKRLSELEARS